jgi:hypothetical protein
MMFLRASYNHVLEDKPMNANVLKYLTIPTVLIALVGCSAVPASSGNADAAEPTTAGNADIQCVQEGLNEIGYDAGPENGLDGPSLQSALVSFEETEEVFLPTLAEQTAAGICDVLRGQLSTFAVFIAGEPDVDLVFRAFSDGAVTLETEIAETAIVSGRLQRVLLGERLMKNVTNYCIMASTGYGFKDAAGNNIYTATCDVLPEEMDSSGGYLIYEATVVER